MFQELHHDTTDEDAACAAIQCMKALNTILYCCHASPEILLQLEASLHPLLNSLLREEGIEYFEVCSVRV